MPCRKSVPQAFDVTNQQVSAAVGEREREEKRSTFDLEPPIAGHRSFPKRFGERGAELVIGPATSGRTRWRLCRPTLAFEFSTGPFYGAGTKPGLRRLSRLRLLTGWDRQMLRDGQADVYRVHAAQCVLLAQKADDPESKLALLDMARSWQALANQNDKNS
jgi:hypothetical protein